MSWLFESTNKSGKTLAKLSKKNTEMNKIKNERGQVTMNTTEIQIIILRSHERL